MKHLRLFEQFISEAELSATEQAIVNRGLNLMTESQGAFCFCIASGWEKDLKNGDSNTPFLNVAPTDKDWPEWTKIKPQSLAHAVRKMKKFMGLIDPEAEYSRGDKPYRKLINFCNKFSDMPKQDVLNLAAECMAAPDEDTIEEFRPKPKEQLANKDIDNTGRLIDDLVTTFQKTNPDLSDADAIKKAKRQVVQKQEKDPVEVDKLYAAWIKRSTAKSIRP